MTQSWHTLSTKQVLEYFGITLSGLSNQQVSINQRKYGENRLPEARLDSLWAIFFRQFQSPLIYILLIASIIVFLIQERTDAIIILFVLLFNAVVGTIQEGKAQNTLASLNHLIRTKALVLREGVEKIIDDFEVVTGDILVLQEGDKVAADARVILSNTLTLDESPLTGESVPVYKFTEQIAQANITNADMKNMVFKGTNVVSGGGLAVVVATGIESVIGSISKKISTIQSEDPLKADVRMLSRVIIITVTSIVTLLFFVGIYSGKPAREMFTTVVSLSVSLIPEGLPIVLTLILATGVWRMGRQNALVKKLQAVESLGQASVIALDKTGTITKNEMVVQKVLIADKIYQIEGTGYAPEGQIRQGGRIIESLNDHDLVNFAETIAGCATAVAKFNQEKQAWQISGDPTEAAVAVLAEKIGIKKQEFEQNNPKLAEILFSSKTKYHAVLRKGPHEYKINVIGAPETIIDLSIHNKNEKKVLGDSLNKLAAEGLRVVAVSFKKTKKSEITPDDVMGLTLLGFAGMIDALRPEVKDAVKKAQGAGIKTVMITGDHRATALAVAAEAKIYSAGDQVLTGSEIEQLSDEQLVNRLPRITVFARVSPDHKLKIIRAYKSSGDIIAMTGDGVNDAPSLVAADLGIAMGKIGTEVAKEAADIVLLDDNFGSVVSAIEEGRSIFNTIRKVVLYLFSTSAGEVLIIAGSLFLGFPLPILASQIIWLNFITDGFLDVALAMEPKEAGLLSSKRSSNSFLDALSFQRMLTMAIPMAVGSLLLFNFYYHLDLVKAMTITLTAMAVFQWFNAWNCRSETKSIFGLNFFSNKYLVGATLIVIILQLFAVYHPFMQQFLKTKSLTGTEWLLVILIAFSIIVTEEMRKLIFSKRHG